MTKVQLVKWLEAKQADETLDDTLMDLANYAIMELTERKCEKEVQTV